MRAALCRVQSLLAVGPWIWPEDGGVAHGAHGVAQRGWPVDVPRAVEARGQREYVFDLFCTYDLLRQRARLSAPTISLVCFGTVRREEEHHRAHPDEHEGCRARIRSVVHNNSQHIITMVVSDSARYDVTLLARTHWQARV